MTYIIHLMETCYETYTIFVLERQMDEKDLKSALLLNISNEN